MLDIIFEKCGWEVLIIKVMEDMVLSEKSQKTTKWAIFQVVCLIAKQALGISCYKAF